MLIFAKMCFLPGKESLRIYENGIMRILNQIRGSHRFFRTLLLGFSGCAFSYSPAVFASIITNVDVVNFAFQPPTIRINVNDQVKWTWQTSDHSTTSNGGLCDSGVHNQGFSYTHTFSSSGAFPYHCSVHLFTGSVVVTNSPPTTAITNPPNGAVMGAPATFTLKATASDPDGGVTNVQFFQGTTFLGNVRTAPYFRAITNLGAGDYTFSAVATDSGGLRATNAITTHVVTPAPIILSAPRRGSLANFEFNYTASTGLTYSVQRSADLTTWTGVSTNTAVTNPSLFTDNSALNGPVYYRVRLQPNP